MDWRKNRIAFAAVLFVVLLGVTLWAGSRRDRQPTSASEVPTIEIDKDAITVLEVNRPEGDRIVLSNTAGAHSIGFPSASSIVESRFAVS